MITIIKKLKQQRNTHCNKKCSSKKKKIMLFTVYLKKTKKKKNKHCLQYGFVTWHERP